MRILQLGRPQQLHLHHGGCRVLTVRYRMPNGTSPAARHFVDMTSLLLRYAREILLPDCARTLEDLIANGQYARFRRRLYDIRLQEKAAKRGVEIMILAELSASDAATGDVTLSAASLSTLWSMDGTLQRARSYGKTPNIIFPLEISKNM